MKRKESYIELLKARKGLIAIYLIGLTVVMLQLRSIL